MTDTHDPKLEQLVRKAGRRTPMPDDVRSRLESSFRAELHQVRRTRMTTRLTVGIGLAACLVLSVFMVNVNQPVPIQEVATVTRLQGEALWHTGDFHGPMHAGAKLRSGDKISTVEGGVAFQPLTNGLDVRLSAHTEVIVVDAQTLRLITGAVYVDATPGASQTPYSIQANEARIDHIGTQYLVSVSGNNIEVAVREGEVQIVQRNKEPIVSRADHSMGETVTIDGSGIKRQPISSHDERWLWTHELTPALQTHDMYLRDFLDWYARQTGIEISYASADIEHAIVNTETHRIKGNLDTDIVVALDEAMLVDGFTATPQDGRVVISR